MIEQPTYALFFGVIHNDFSVRYLVSASGEKNNLCSTSAGGWSLTLPTHNETEELSSRADTGYLTNNTESHTNNMANTQVRGQVVLSSMQCLRSAVVFKADPDPPFSTRIRIR
jgi:hypothetical protein